MELNPYLSFNGQCEEAFKFYEKSLAAKITFMMPHEGSPMESSVPPEWHKKIMHATLSVQGQLLHGADAPPDHYKKPQGFSVSISLNDAAEADRIFNALAEGGSIFMPIQETFWAVRFGMLSDKFGIPWMINCAKPMGSGSV